MKCQVSRARDRVAKLGSVLFNLLPSISKEQDKGWLADFCPSETEKDELKRGEDSDDNMLVDDGMTRQWSRTIREKGRERKGGW